MSLPVHHVPSLEGVVPGAVVLVEGDEAHHAVAVRRLRVGEHVVLADGRGLTATGAVSATAKRELSVAVDAVRRHERPVPELVVVQALPKGDRGELAVEVLTEVGVSRVVPWSAARSVTTWKGERATRALARWRSTAREAAKQSRRAWHPEVDGLAGTADLLGLVAAADLAVVLHEQAARPLAGLDVPCGPGSTVVVVVGPEGGITDAELAAFADVGALPVRLGTEVLRTSTAGVVACAALLSATPRWR